MHLLFPYASDSSVVHWLVVFMKYTLIFCTISNGEVHRGKSSVISPFTWVVKHLLIWMLITQRKTAVKPLIFTMQGNINKINFQITGYSELKETHKDHQVQLKWITHLVVEPRALAYQPTKPILGSLMASWNNRSFMLAKCNCWCGYSIQDNLWCKKTSRIFCISSQPCVTVISRNAIILLFPKRLLVLRKNLHNSFLFSADWYRQPH